jgi:hypothetical protein
MKSIIALVLSVILCIFTMNVLAGEDYYFARDDEELYGTCINLYYGTNPAQKLVFSPNGTGWSAANANSKLPIWRMRYLITAKWRDSQGNIMYKTHWVGSLGNAGYSLCRISNSGKTLEYMNSHNDYPKEINPKSPYYRMYNRK